MDKKEFIATLVERLYQRGNETQIKESKKLNQEEQALLVVKGELTDMQVRCVSLIACQSGSIV